MRETPSTELQERQDPPQVLPPSAEPLNAASLQTCGNPTEDSMLGIPLGCGYHSREGARISGHAVFVVGVDGTPLTPTTSAKARKLLKGKQAKPIWNRFGQFGLRMLVKTGTITPNTILGVDFGTKFEGYAVVTGKENNLAVMWKLPDKKNIVRKCEERRQLRRARRFRNCRRKQCRFSNRDKKGFIAPSQLVIIYSRLKAISEFLKCYPIKIVAIEDVKFNHAKYRWGKNFSTIEVGKTKIYEYIHARAFFQMYNGYDTPDIRETYGYRKSSSKNAEVFTSHCSDALAMAVDASCKQYVPEGSFIVVDDTYRSIRRKLHDSQFSKGGIRYKYSTGNFRGIRKGTMCAFGQIVGGTRNSAWIRNKDNKRVGKTMAKINWLSHHFKYVRPISSPLKSGGSRGGFL